MSSSALEDMLAAILARGRADGLTHGAIAARAGLTPETLSRLRHKGDCRLATMLALAEAVGYRLELRATDAPASAARQAPPTPPAPPAQKAEDATAVRDQEPGQRPRHLL